MVAGRRLRWLAARAASALVAVWLVASLAFAAVRLAPGDPSRPADPRVPPAEAAALRRIYGLDRPPLAQYGAWLGGLCRGDLGWSFHYRRPVGRVLGAALPHTLRLGCLALALQYGTALALALLGARRTGPLPAAAHGATTALYALPTFWLGLLAVRWLAADGTWMAAGSGPSPLGGLRQAALPAAVLAAANLAPVYRLTEGALRQALGSPYVVAARGRGLGEGRVLWRHALRNAARPAIQRLGLDLPGLLGGSLVVEVLFSRPGLGRIAHQAFVARDFPLLAAGATAAGALVVAGSLLADLGLGLVDPRVARA
jgi:ABC-type dipeptide/oligopeptide/nickel transport system permease component